MEILKKLKIDTRNNELYQEALTHSSYANEKKVNSYERLEFLGDAVLQLVITEYLYKTNTSDEGELTKKRAKLVCENALYIYGIRLGISDYILLGRGEAESGGGKSKAIIADITEAFLGAVFLDQGYVSVKNFIYKNIIPIIEQKQEDFMDDYKTEFQEFVQTKKKSVEYFLLSESGPAHNKKYKVAVKIDDITYGVGVGSSKKTAEQNAAKAALKKSNIKA